MDLKHRKAALVQFGKYIGLISKSIVDDSQFANLNTLFYQDAQELIQSLHYKNGWFTESSVRMSLSAISEMLDAEKMNQWLLSYDISPNNEFPKKVGIIMAGNIPLVGFHDLLCVLISGNCALVKLSSDDQFLLPFLFKILCAIEPDFKNLVEFQDQRLSGMQAVIATGSGNTARYFEYYFGSVPHIIRKNRNSVAILDGNETPAQLEKLGADIFSYFGLGCRNVSKVFIPSKYNLDYLFSAIFPYRDIIMHNKYANNFDYNRAVYLLGKDKEGLLENGFIFLVRSSEYASPVAVMYYDYYDSKELLCDKLEAESDKIQCIVSETDLPLKTVGFGKAQQPELWDYADNVDTLKFLTQLN